MSGRFLSFLCALMAAVLLLVSCAEEPQRRIATPNEVLGDDLPRAALVIGNGKYQSVAALANPANDAQLVASSLKNAGYRVYEGSAQIDLSRIQMQQAVDAFAADVSKTGGIAFIYYAGHGIQVDGQNYLIPVDAQIRSTSDIDTQTVNLQSLLDAVSESNIEMKVIVIDACRDNPFEAIARSGNRGDVEITSADTEAESGLRTLSSGLSQLIAPPGALVAFATAPGTAALDGDGNNSPYAKALANVIGEPDLRVEDVFISVRNRVRSETSGAQVPWETSSLTSVAAFSGAASTVNSSDGSYSNQTATSVWDGEYFAEMRCGPGSYRAYFPIVQQGKARSTLTGDSPEDLDWLFLRDGAVQLSGTGQNSSDRWTFNFKGTMSNDEAVLDGTVQGQNCKVKIWRSTSPNTPLIGTKLLSEDELREAFTGNTVVSEAGYKQYFDPSGKTILKTDDGYTKEYRWSIKGDAFCTDWDGELTCRDDEKLGRKDGNSWFVVSVERNRGRAWPVRIVRGKAF